MKKGLLVVEIIIGFLIVLCASLLIAKPFLVKEKDSEKEKTNQKEEETVVRDTTSITLGINVIIEGEGAEYKESENNVYINRGGVYEFTGIFNEGSIIVNTDDKIEFKLSGVNVNNISKPFLSSSYDIVLNLNDSSTNIIKSNSIDGTLKFKELLIKGNGSLVLGNAGKNLNGEIFNIESGDILIVGNNKENIQNKSTQKYLEFSLEDSVTMEDKYYLVDDLEYRKELNIPSVGKYIFVSNSDLGEGNYRIEKENIG